MWPWCVKMPTQNLLRFVTVANVDDEDRVGNSLLHTWELRLGNKAKLLFRLWAQGFEVEVQARFLSWSMVNILLLMFCRGYEVESLSRFWRWSLIKIWVELVIWPNRLLWKDELNPRVRCAFGIVLYMKVVFYKNVRVLWISNIYEG